MSGTTVTVSGDLDEGQAPAAETATAFAAGVAAATSEQAAEDAEEAEQTAEQAAEVAEAALSTSWDAEAAVAELHGRVDALTAEIAELRAAQEPVLAEAVVAAEAAEVAPAPEPVSESATEDTTEKRHGDEKPKRKSYGSNAWFGS